MNAGTILVFLLVMGAVFLAGRRLWKDKKEGKGCSGNCAGCSGCGMKYPSVKKK